MIGLLTLLCFFLPAVVSCDKDDDKDEPKPDEPTMNISEITGKYSGTLGWKVMTTEDKFSGDFEVSIAKDDSDKDEVTVTLPECTFAPPIPNSKPFTIPSAIVDGVDVEFADGVYTLSESDFKVEISGVQSPGSVTGTIKDGKATLLYTITPGAMPMPINFTFTGTLK